jgi:spore germination protein KC
MIRFIRAAWLAILLTLAPCLLSGCWSVNEINDLAIITVLGIDKTDKAEFKISALVIRPSGSVSSISAAGGSSQQAPAIIATSTGDTVFSAMRKLSSVLAKKMYWAHLQAIVIGEQAAGENLIAALDILARQHEFRKNIHILATRGAAEDIVRTKPLLEGSLGAEIDGLVRYSRYTGSTTVNDISHFVASISSDTKDHFTGEISPSLYNGVKLTQDGGSVSALSIRGSAVFKKGKLIGWLNENETRGVMWVLGKVKSGIVEVTCPDDKHGKISLEITRASRQLKPSFSNDKPVMDATINVDAQIGEAVCPQLDLNTDTLRKLNELLSAQVKLDIDQALQKVQKQWQTDIFQFGEAIYKKHPDQWKELAPEWRKNKLKAMKVNIQVKPQIWRSGLIDDPVQPDESR